MFYCKKFALWFIIRAERRNWNVKWLCRQEASFFANTDNSFTLTSVHPSDIPSLPSPIPKTWDHISCISKAQRLSSFSSSFTALYTSHLAHSAFDTSPVTRFIDDSPDSAFDIQAIMPATLIFQQEAGFFRDLLNNCPYVAYAPHLSVSNAQTW